MQKYFSLLLLFSCLFFSCNKEKQLLDIIPADASYAIEVDVLKLEEKAKTGEEKTSKLDFGKSLLNLLRTDENNLTLSNLLDQLTLESGLDLSQKMIVFESGSSYTSVVGLEVSDEKDLSSFIKHIVPAESIKKTKGVKWFTLDERSAFAWDSSIAIILTTAIGAEEEMPGEIRRFFELKKENRLLEQEDLKSFRENLSDISIYNGIEMLNTSLSKYIGIDLGLGASLNGVIPLSYISFNNGDVTMHTEFIFRDKAKEAEMKNVMENIFGNSTGNHFAHIDNVPQGFLASNLKGLNLKELLGRDALGKTTQDIQFINLNDILSNLDGDLTCTIEVDTSGEVIPTSLLLDMKDPAAIQTKLNELVYSYGAIKPIGDNRYKLPVNDLILGTQGNLLYISKDPDFITKPHSGKAVDSKMMEKIKNSRIFMCGTSGLINSLTASKSNPKSQGALSMYLSECKLFTISVSNEMKIEAQIQFTDTSRNSIEVLTQLEQFTKRVQN